MYFMKLFSLLLLVFFFGVHTPGLGQTINSQDELIIDSYIREQIETNAPGMAVGFVIGGEVVYEKYYGLASLQHRVPVDRNTRFNIASVAKQFTALCILDLTLDGIISLDDDIRTYVPNLFPKIESPIRISHLLNHSSGIRDVYDLMSLKGNPWWRNEGLDNTDAMELLAEQVELNFEPDSSYMYSNSNYIILADIVTKVSGLSFHDYSKRLFEKLGMNQTAFLKDYMHVIPNQALPYSDWGDGIWQQYPMITNLYGDGFLYTTLNDQLVYEKALQRRKEDNALFSLSQQDIPGSLIKKYGFGLELSDRFNHKAVHHAGSTGSYHAQVVRFPEDDLSIVVMSNNGNLWSGFIADKIAKTLLAKGTTPSDVPLPPSDVSTKIPRDALIGEYKSVDNTVVRILNRDGYLLWKMDNNRSHKLVRDGVNYYRWEGNPEMIFSFEASNTGGINMTSYPNGVKSKKYIKMSPFTPNEAYIKELTGKYTSKELDTYFDFFINKDGLLSLRIPGRSKARIVEIVQKEALLQGDYRMHVKRDNNDQSSEIWVTYNRVKNLRFIKKRS